MGKAELAERLLRGERSAVSEALNLVDDRRPDQRTLALKLLDRLESQSGSARHVGITGAPGAGKSTLLNALVRTHRAQGRSVGIVAVDPSSRISGGALLGDRQRMRAAYDDDGVFVRSMAARDRLGGIADATYASVAILSAVFDIVFVETVGIGQSESDVARLVDTLVLVVPPGAGDVLQFMKAGILELPDIVVVNKADLGAIAERTAAELSAGLALGEITGAWRPPVLLVSASEPRGIDDLVSGLDDHRRHLETTSELAARRRSHRVAFVTEALSGRYGSYGIERIGGAEGLAKRVAEAEDRSPFTLADSLGREIETELE